MKFQSLHLASTSTLIISLTTSYFFPDPRFVLSGSQVSPPVKTGAAAHAWLRVDDTCALHYQVVTSGLDRNDRESASVQLLGYDVNSDGSMRRRHTRVFKGIVGDMVSRYSNSTFMFN